MDPKKFAIDLWRGNSSFDKIRTGDVGSTRAGAKRTGTGRARILPKW